MTGVTINADPQKAPEEVPVQAVQRVTRGGLMYSEI